MYNNNMQLMFIQMNCALQTRDSLWMPIKKFDLELAMFRQKAKFRRISSSVSSYDSHCSFFNPFHGFIMAQFLAYFEGRWINIRIYNGVKDTIEFQDYWSSAAMENVMQNILQMLNNTCHWMGPTAVADNANAVLLYLQKIIVSHYMSIFPDISRRARNMYHNLQDDDIIKNIFNSERHKNKVGMQIPAWMITDEMKHTKHYQMTTSTPRSPNLDKEVAESSAPRRSTVIHLLSLAEHKSHEEQEARENVALVDEHLASEEIEKMVNEQENIANDSLIPRNDEPTIPGTRIEPKSNKESPEVEITKEKEVEIIKETLAVDITNVVIPVNVTDEDEEITDEVYELKRREKGKIVDETRNSPIPTPIRSPRIYTNLVSSDTEKLQELTDTPHTTSSSSSPYKKLAKTNRLLSLFKTKPSLQKIQELLSRVTRTIWLLVYTSTSEVHAKKVIRYTFEIVHERQKAKEETERLIAKAILQERGNIQAQISTQIENAIANVIPSQVDASVRSYMSGHILHVHPAQSQTSSVPEQQYQLYLAMKADPQLQQQDIAIWLALQMKFERNTISTEIQQSKPLTKREVLNLVQEIADQPNQEAHHRLSLANLKATIEYQEAIQATQDIEAPAVGFTKTSDYKGEKFDRLKEKVHTIIEKEIQPADLEDSISSLAKRLDNFSISGELPVKRTDGKIHIRGYRAMTRGRYQAARATRKIFGRNNYNITLESTVDLERQLELSRERRANLVPAEVLYLNNRSYMHYIEEVQEETPWWSLETSDGKIVGKSLEPWNHIEVAIQTHGYDIWQGGESNLLVTMDMIGRLTNTSYMGFQYSIDNVVDHLTTTGITTIPGERRSVEELEGMSWNLRPSEQTSIRISSRVAVNKRLNRSLSLQFERHRRAPQPARYSVDQHDREILGEPSRKWDYYVRYDAPINTTPIEEIAATGWGDEFSDKEATPGKVTILDKKDGCDDDERSEGKILQKSEIEWENPFAAKRGEDHTVLHLSKDEEKDDDLPYPKFRKFKQFAAQIINKHEEHAFPIATDAKSSISYQPPPDAIIGPAVYPPARQNPQPAYKPDYQFGYPQGRGNTFNGGYGEYHNSQWTLPPAWTESGVMLVLPADPGLWSDVISRWESITINRLNSQTWSDNKAKLAFVENLLGESEKLMWQQWRTAYPGAYSTLEIINLDRITCEETKNLWSFLEDFQQLAVKSGKLYFPSTTEKLFAKLPPSLSKKIEESFKAKHPGPNAGVLLAIKFTHTFVSEMCKDAMLAKELRDLSLCFSILIPGYYKNKKKKYGIGKSRTYKGKPHNSHEGHFAKDCRSKQGNITRSAVYQELDLDDNWDIVAVDFDDSSVYSISEGEGDVHQNISIMVQDTPFEEAAFMAIEGINESDDEQSIEEDYYSHHAFMFHPRPPTKIADMVQSTGSWKPDKELPTESKINVKGKQPHKPEEEKDFNDNEVGLLKELLKEKKEQRKEELWQSEKSLLVKDLIDALKIIDLLKTEQIRFEEQKDEEIWKLKTQLQKEKEKETGARYSSEEFPPLGNSQMARPFMEAEVHYSGNTIITPKIRKITNQLYNVKVMFEIPNCLMFGTTAIIDTGASACCINKKVIPEDALEHLTQTVFFNGLNSR
ncbi:hypothetical protein Tco_0564270 [Tanacetum coccineum]